MMFTDNRILKMAVAIVMMAGAASTAVAQKVASSWVVEKWDYAEGSPPPLRARIGELSPSVTSPEADAVRYVHQGVNLMMGYWDIESYRCFLHASRIDPNCGMAYWGMALTMIGSEAELQPFMDAAANKSFELAGFVDGIEGVPMTDEERDYIRSLAIYVKHGPEDFAKVMAEISGKNPTARLARLMNILFVRDGYDENGKPHLGQVQALDAVEKYLAKYPGDLQALSIKTQMLVLGANYKAADESGRLLASLNPGTAYMLHLPGLVQYRLGNYEDAVEAFTAAREFDEAYFEITGVNPVEVPFYSKNLEALALTLVEAGRRREALLVAKDAAAISLDGADFKGTGAKEVLYGGMTLPARVHLRCLDWKSALEATPDPKVDQERRPLPSRVYYEAIISYATARDALSRGDIVIGRRQLLRLEALGTGAIDTIPKAIISAQVPHWNEALENMDMMVNDLRAQLNAAEDSWDLAATWWDSMARRQKGVDADVIRDWPLTAGEVKGWTCLQAGYAKEARRAFQAAIKHNPVSGFALAGLSRAFAAEENADKAERSKRLAGVFLSGADPLIREKYLDEKIGGGDEGEAAVEGAADE